MRRRGCPYALTLCGLRSLEPQAMRLRDVKLAYATFLFGKVTRSAAPSDQQQMTRISRLAYGGAPAPLFRRQQIHWAESAENLRNHIFVATGMDLHGMKILAAEWTASRSREQRVAEEALTKARAAVVEVRQRGAVARMEALKLAADKVAAGRRRKPFCSAVAVLPAATAPVAAAASAPVAAAGSAPGLSARHFFSPRWGQQNAAAAGASSKDPAHVKAVTARELAVLLQMREEGGVDDDTEAGAGAGGGSGGGVAFAAAGSGGFSSSALYNFETSDDGAAGPALRYASEDAAALGVGPRALFARSAPQAATPWSQPLNVPSASEKRLYAMMVLLANALHCDCPKELTDALAWALRTAAARLESNLHPGQADRVKETLHDIKIFTPAAVAGLEVEAPAFRDSFGIPFAGVSGKLTFEGAAVLLHDVMARWNGTGVQLVPVSAVGADKGKGISVCGDKRQRVFGLRFYRTRYCPSRVGAHGRDTLNYCHCCEHAFAGRSP